MTTTTLSRTAATQRRTLRVLVVDDEVAIRELFRRALADAGCTVRTAGTALEALAALDAEAAEVVVTDLLMPGLRGEILAEQIRVRHPAIRVVVVSGWLAPRTRGALAASGVRVVLAKPLTELLTLVEAVCASDKDGRES